MSLENNLIKIDYNLIGIDRLNTVNAYYHRDNVLNVNNNENIIKCLKKLDYYNLNIDIEIRKNYIDTLLKKIGNELSTNWDSSIKNKTINELIVYEIDQLLVNKIDRSNYLSKYLDKNDLFDFYNDLTLEELQYLGY